MNTWLLDHLIAAGHVTEHGTMRRAKVRTCDRCRARILVGLDENDGALETRVDPVPLSPLSEALALIEGRFTVAIHREGGRFVIDRRTAVDIADTPASTGQREDVMREHKCGTPDLAGALVSSTTFAEAAPPIPAGSPAPF